MPDQEGYEVRWAPTAQRDLQRLPEKIASALVEFAYGSLASNPQRLARPLQLECEGLHGTRRGEYRLVYRIDQDQRIIMVHRVGHRGNIYRPRG